MTKAIAIVPGLSTNSKDPFVENHTHAMFEGHNEISFELTNTLSSCYLAFIAPEVLMQVTEGRDICGLYHCWTLFATILTWQTRYVYWYTSGMTVRRQPITCWLDYPAPQKEYMSGAINVKSQCPRMSKALNSSTFVLLQSHIVKLPRLLSEWSEKVLIYADSSQCRGEKVVKIPRMLVPLLATSQTA